MGFCFEYAVGDIKDEGCGAGGRLNVLLLCTLCYVLFSETSPMSAGSICNHPLPVSNTTFLARHQCTF
jgi:hypothetical protein